MTCDLEKDLLSGYLDGELVTSQRDAVERHIAACSACLRELGELKGAVMDLKSLKRAGAPSEVAAVVARQTAAPAVLMGRWVRMSVAAAAVALFAVSVVIILRQQAPGADAPAGLALKQEGKKATGEAAWDARKPEGKAKDDDAEGEREDVLRDLEAKPAPAAKPASPAPGARFGGREAQGDEEGDLADKPEGDKNKETEDRRAGPDTGVSLGSPPPPPVMTVSSKEIAAVRTKVEELLLKLDLTPKVGVKELGDDDDRVKDEYVTVELTDAELADVRKRIDELKAQWGMTTLEKERARLDDTSTLALEKKKDERLNRADEPAKEPEETARTRRGGEPGERARGSRPVRKRVILRFTTEPLPPEPKAPPAERK